MDDKRDVGFVGSRNLCIESDLENDGEQATAAVILPQDFIELLIPSSPPSTGTSADFSTGLYNQSHHSRRSSDDREEDLLLERERTSRRHVHALVNNGGDETHLTQPASLERRADLSVSSGSSPDELDVIAESFGNLSLQWPFSPQQECDRHSNSQYVSGVVKEAKFPREGCVDVESFSSDAQQLFDVSLFKRRIIARDELEHALFIIPLDKFREVFPKVKKDEALVYHGTEFPVGEEHQTTNVMSLHQHFVIADYLHVTVEIAHGQNFTIVSPRTTTATASDIISKSEERVACGFSIKVLTKCTGGKDELYEGSIRVKLQSGNRTMCLIFPIAYYEASVSPWLSDSVIPMPEEDREALRSCHVALLDNIGDVISLSEHLYQHKILDSDDLDEIRSITKKRDRNAFVLHTLMTRGNILDFVIKLMQGKRENQGAAAILQSQRYHGTDM